MIFKTKAVKLVMWDKVNMPESESKEVDGKKVWVKIPGKFIEKTNYTFRDITGEKLVAFGDNSHRTLEGELCDIELEVSYNDFTRKNQIKLFGITKSK